MLHPRIIRPMFLSFPMLTILTSMELVLDDYVIDIGILEVVDHEDVSRQLGDLGLNIKVV